MATPSAEMSVGHTDTFLSFQIFLIFKAKFSYFFIFSASVLKRLWVKGTAISITVLFYSLYRTAIYRIIIIIIIISILFPSS